MRPPHPDQMRELMGVANLSSTAEIKAAQKAAKANYAAELQAQMRANEEAKLRERMERLGIAPPPPLQPPPPPGMMPLGGGGPGSPGGMAGGGIPSPPRAPPPPSLGLPVGFSPPPPGLPSFGSLGAGPPPPAWGQPPPPYPPPPYHPPAFGIPSPSRQPPPPPPFMPGGGYGPPQPAAFGAPPPYGPPAVPYGMGVYGPSQPPAPPPLLPGPAPPPGAPGPNTLQRLEQQAKKDQYRLELEAQIREREERRAAEKARQREEDMRKEAEMAAYAQNNAGRGGGGAPHRDAGGNIVANFAQMQRMGGGGGVGGQGPPSPGRMGGGMGMGMGPPMGMMGGGMGMGMMPPPPPPLVGSPSGMGMGMGMGGGGGPGMMGGPGPMVGSPSGMGPGPLPPPMGGGGMMGGPMDVPPGGGMPNFRFRSDNPYLTPKELDNKQRQARELQEALEQQIQEKRRAKELERNRELAEEAREEARLRADAEQLRTQATAENGGGPKDRQEVVADAWEKARLEAEELRRNKFAAKRGGGGGTKVAVAWGENDGQEAEQAAGSPPGGRVSPGRAMASSPPPFGAGMGGGVGGLGEGFPPPPLATHFGADGGAGGLPATPLVVEKVRQVAAEELAAVKQELAAEAAQLREVVAAQGQQVAALKSHAERMEAEAERAREQVAAMRLGLITHASGNMGAADSALRQPAPALVDIGLDLPPTGAVLRRSAAPLPVYGMGPPLPAVNSSAILADAPGASAMHATGGADTAVGQRTINPLEASLAGESVFIYPNGQEMGRCTNAAERRGGGLGGAGTAALGGPSGLASPGAGGLGVLGGGGLPFESLNMAAAAIPTVITAQELNPDTVPPTPAGDVPVAAAAVRGSAVKESGLRDSAPAEVSEPQQQTLAAEAAAGGRQTPLDVDFVMSRNKEKLDMLKGMPDLVNGAASIEVLDEFLARYAAQRPGLPERTATPVLRLATPPPEPTTAAGGPAAKGARAATVQPASHPSGMAIYSSRTNSAGPLPVGDGRVLGSAGSARLPASRDGSGPGAGMDASSGPSTLKLTRRNSFTGDASLQEGVLSQCLVSEPLAARPKTGPEAGSGGGLRSLLGSSNGGGTSVASPPNGRPPMLPNNRYSGSGKAGSTAASLSSQPSSSRMGPEPPTGSGGGAAERPQPGRPSSRPRASDDGSRTATSGWPSYNPSREGPRTSSAVLAPRPRVSDEGSSASRGRRSYTPTRPGSRLTATAAGAQSAGAAVPEGAPEGSFHTATSGWPSYSTSRDGHRAGSAAAASTAAPSRASHSPAAGSDASSRPTYNPPRDGPRAAAGAAPPKPSPRRGSDDGAETATSAWPSYNPFLEGPRTSTAAAGAAPPPRSPAGGSDATSWPTYNPSPDGPRVAGAATASTAAPSRSVQSPAGGSDSTSWPTYNPSREDSGRTDSMTAAAAAAVTQKPGRPSSRPRASDDGSRTAASGWPSYNPSREGSKTPLSRSRSLTTAPGPGSGRPGTDLVVPTPREDTLDMEMRRGLGTPPSAGQQPGGAANRPGGQRAAGDAPLPPFPIPRSPMLAGRLHSSGSVR